MTKALGLIEVNGLVGAIEAADASLKAANVEMLGISKVGGGIVTVQISGDVGAVTAAVDAGVHSAAKITVVRSKHVIPRLDDSILSKVVATKQENKTNNETETIIDNEEEKIDIQVDETPEVDDRELLVKKSNASLKEIVHNLYPDMNIDEIKRLRKLDLVDLIMKDKEGDN